MKLKVEALRQRMLELRRVSTLPWWRTSYAEFLLDRVDEYIAVAREPEALGVMERVDRWLLQHEQQLQKKSEMPHAKAHAHIRLWSKDDLASELHRVRGNLNLRRSLVPGPEREALTTRLDRVERHLSADRLDEARAELNGVRASLVRRLTRSYRAWSVAQPRIGAGSVAAPVRRADLVPSGPYNNRRNLNEMVALVGERDPIWVEDFIEVYNDLLQYAERLSDPDKKKRK